MTGNVVVTVAPVIEPVTLAEAKAQCRVDIDADDDFIEDILIPAARDYCEQRDWRARRPAVSHTGEDLRAVGFDGHPASSAVAALTPAELFVERVEIELEARGHAVDGDDERLAVRFTCGEKAQHLRALYLLPCAL